MFAGYLVNDALVYKRVCFSQWKRVFGLFFFCSRSEANLDLVNRLLIQIIYRGALNHKRALPVCRIHTARIKKPLVRLTEQLFFFPSSEGFLPRSVL